MTKLKQYATAVASALGLLVLAVLGLAGWWRERKARQELAERVAAMADANVDRAKDSAERELELVRAAENEKVKNATDNANRDDGGTLADLLRGRGAGGKP